MQSQLPGACLRATLVAAMILAPSLLLGEAAPGGGEAVLLVASFAGLATLAEYGARAPALVTFRAAPPVNRIRFATLAAMSAILAVAAAAPEGGAALSRLALAVGLVLGQAMDLPGSPVRLVLSYLPADATPAQAQALRAAAGLGYLVGLVGLTAFAIALRLRGWPSGRGAFNLWVNLPTFDQGRGADAVARLRRDGAVNVLLGILAPYLSPPVAVWVAGGSGVSVLDDDLTLVWVMTTWAFLPVSLLARGIAMRRLAAMIALRRRRLGADGADGDPAFLPA